MFRSFSLEVNISKQPNSLIVEMNQTANRDLEKTFDRSGQTKAQKLNESLGAAMAVKQPNIHLFSQRYIRR